MEISRSSNISFVCFVSEYFIYSRLDGWPELFLSSSAASLLRAFAIEEVLLGPAGVGAEVGAGELSQLAGGDAFLAGEVDAAEGAFDPHVDGEGVVESAGEQQHAIGDFLANPGQFDQLFQRAVVFHRAQGVEVELAAVNQAGGGEEVFGPETEFAIPELLVRSAGDGGNGREGVVLGVNRLAEPQGQQTNDLADLDDLFRRTGDERGETFPGFLADDAQAVMVAGGLVEQGVAGKGFEDFRQGNVERQVALDGNGRWSMVDGGWGNDVPFKGVVSLSQPPDFLADDADEPAIGVALPAKGLAAFQRGGERKIRNIDCVRHFWYKLARGTLVMLNEEVNTACPARSGMHFVGICGTAMASVAALCRELGHTVTGSDENVYPPMSTFLESRGIRIQSGFHESNLDHHPDLIVIGNAMKRGNPEIERALDERLPMCSLPELVRDRFLRGKHSVVIAGTHGKTTTTSLLAWAMESAGLEPGFLIGGIPNNFGCGARVGKGKHFIIEGDEYDTAFFDKRSKFVHYLPDTVVLNNIEFDHADIFRDLASVKRAFRQLVALVPRRGVIIANGEDATVREVAAGAHCRVRFFTKADAAGFALPMAGEHNQHNAAAAVVCATELGLSREQIQRGFATFTGIKRRMEVRGEAAGVTVLDDFAHHPTAIAETIRAIREKYPRRRLWALFEPRSNTTRRNVFQQELAESLALADGVFISRVDRLQELGENERLNPEAIIKQLRSQGRVAEYSPNADEIVNRLVPNLHDRDVVAVFSNGKFDGIHDKLLTRLRQGA